MQISVASFFAILAMGSVSNADKFAATCGNCYAEQTGFSCDCGNGRTYLDLNPYLGNSGGTLVWNSGYYSSSCNSCYMLQEGGIFGCSCGKGKDGYNDTYIDLNPYISNIGNTLHAD